MLKQSPSLVMLRRSFLVSSAGTLAGLFLPNICPTIATPHRNNSLPENPIDEIYLQKGLNALARAHQMSSMAGHLGASLVAGYFIGKQRSRLDPVVCQGIEGDMKRVMDGESVFGKKMSPKAPLVDSQLFESFPQQQADPNLIDLIAERLAGNIQQPRQSGHNVIFASLALRGLKAAPQLATPKLVDGIVRLIGMFDNQSPGSGYYGKAKGRIHGNKIVLPDDDATPTYDDVTGMANTVLDEVIGLETNINRVGYGGMVHIINHCAAIADLQELGYEDLVATAVRSHHRHLQLWRNLPNVAQEQGPIKVSQYAPHTAEYWQAENIPYDRALLTHRVKTMYGFDELAAAVDADEKEKTAYQKLRYMM